MVTTNLAVKLGKGRNSAQKIKAKQPFNRAFWRQVMTDDFQALNGNAKTLKQRNRGNGDIFYAAGSKDLLHFFFRNGNFMSYSQNFFRRDHGIAGTGIQRHFNGTFIRWADELGIYGDYTIGELRRTFTFCHREKLRHILRENYLQNKQLRYGLYTSILCGKPHRDGASEATACRLEGWFFPHPFCPLQSAAIRDGTFCVSVQCPESSYKSPLKYFIIDIIRCQGKCW